MMGADPPDAGILDFDAERARVDALAAQLSGLGRWRPAAALHGVVAGYSERLAAARARLGAGPVISVVGPTGSGKSTLVNALVGSDDAVKVGASRPTTRSVQAVARSSADAAPLLSQLGGSQAELVTVAVSELGGAVLLDTPDTDSGECENHRPLLEEALRVSDALVCVFDASNPKRRDNADALKSWVESFPGEFVFIVLNMCDRIPQRELLEDVIPDFRDYIASTWSRPPTAVFHVSGRSGLSDPAWPDMASPLHGLNELETLKDALTALGGARVFSARRVRQARHMRETSQSLVREAVHDTLAKLDGADRDIDRLDAMLQAEIAESSKSHADECGVPLAVELCGAMSDRWWGPVGACLRLWRRFIERRLKRRRKSGFGGLLRDAAYGEAAAQGPNGAAAEMSVIEHWPSAADKLVGAGFSDAVRETAPLRKYVEKLLTDARKSWTAAVDAVLSRKAEQLCGPLLVLVLNLPVICGVAWTAYLLISKFAAGHFLPREFYLHAALVLLLLLLLPFWVLQLLVGRAARSIPGEAAKAIGGGDAGTASLRESVLPELEALRQLADPR